MRIALPDLRPAPTLRRPIVDAAALTMPGLPASLRGKARHLGVSHEAVRHAMIARGLPTDLGTRNARIRAWRWPACPGR